MKVTADRTNDAHRLRGSPESVARVDDTGGNRPVDPQRQADFARAVESSQARRQHHGSLLEQIERLTLPTASDPSLYSNERSIELLQHVVDNVLPRMDTDVDIAEMAAQVLTEEITQRLEWAERHAEAGESHS